MVDSRFTGDKEASLENARSLIEQSANTVCFSGAGLSAESGIATFRDTETDALWSRFDPMELASPDGFSRHPQRVIDWYNWRRQKVAAASPNPAHLALAAHPEIINVTQNVDDLLERAGSDPHNVIHLHGSLIRDRCLADCGYSENINLETPPGLRSCPRCEAPLRPAVVWFGETLPELAWSKAEQACSQADCLVVIGTSASIFPAAGLIQVTKAYGGKVIVINTHPSGASELADIELTGRCGIWLPKLIG